MRLSRVVLTAVLGTLVAGTLLATPAAAGGMPTTAPITIPAGLKGFDNIGTDTTSTLACLQNAGYTFDVINTTGTTWQNEYTATTSVGMSAVLFQGYDPAAWQDVKQGTSRATTAVQKAQSVGYPRGSTIFLNLEETLNLGANGRQTMITWVNNWTKVVTAAGYRAGAYLGVNQISTAADIKAMTGLTAFWKSPSTSAVPASPRGFVMTQSAVDASVCGVTIDINSAGTDSAGAGPVGVGVRNSFTAPTVAGAYVPVTPARLLDTRTNGSGGVPAAGITTLQVTGHGGVPVGAAAVVVNLTAVTPAAPGYLTAYPAGTTRPTTSSVNFATGTTVANLAAVKLSPGGALTVASGSPRPTQLVVDVQGYYLAGTPLADGTFQGLTPVRVLDTRSGVGAAKARVAAGSTLTLQVTGRGGVPATGVGAAVLNLTAVAPTSSGYLTAFPVGAAAPSTSNVNYVAGHNVATAAVVRVSSAGTIAIHNAGAGMVDILADVSGYTVSATPLTAENGTFVPITPARIADTRKSGGALGANLTRAIDVLGSGGVPTTGVIAVAVNVTSVSPTRGGNFIAFPSGISRPTASIVNFNPGATVPNLAFLPVGADGMVDVTNYSTGATQLVVDVEGYVRGT